MDKVFPISALEVVCKAIVLEALTEKLDSKLALELGNDFTDEQYKVAYTTVTTREEREVQLDLLESLGLSLCKLVKAPLIHTTLKLMKGPTKLADLTDMHNFLEKGFYTFKNMKNGEDFIKQLIHKERQVLEKDFN